MYIASFGKVQNQNNYTVIVIEDYHTHLGEVGASGVNHKTCPLRGSYRFMGAHSPSNEKIKVWLLTPSSGSRASWRPISWEVSTETHRFTCETAWTLGDWYSRNVDVHTATSLQVVRRSTTYMYSILQEARSTWISDWPRREVWFRYYIIALVSY